MSTAYPHGEAPDKRYQFSAALTRVDPQEHDQCVAPVQLPSARSGLFDCRLIADRGGPGWHLLASQPQLLNAFESSALGFWYVKIHKCGGQHAHTTVDPVSKSVVEGCIER